uniref:Ribosome silencing factor n=1 Tax=Heterorhabditis bacteriophora TaxID=37862 RepID=A0A1I7X699_HETBA
MSDSLDEFPSEVNSVVEIKGSAKNKALDFL